MKKYIYGAAIVAVVTAAVVFFFRPPETNPPVPSTVLSITFRLPESYEFTEGAPFVLTWRTESPDGTLSVPAADKDFRPHTSPYKLAFTPSPGSVAVILNARLYYCDKTSRMCFQDDFKARVPLSPENAKVIPWDWEIIPERAADNSPNSFQFPRS